MSDDKSKRGGSDRKRISLDEDYEVQYWTNELGVSREELEKAVAAVGDTSDKVREFVGGRKAAKDGGEDS